MPVLSEIEQNRLRHQAYLKSQLEIEALHRTPLVTKNGHYITPYRRPPVIGGNSVEIEQNKAIHKKMLSDSNDVIHKSAKGIRNAPMLVLDPTKSALDRSNDAVYQYQLFQENCKRTLKDQRFIEYFTTLIKNRVTQDPRHGGIQTSYTQVNSRWPEFHQALQERPPNNTVELQFVFDKIFQYQYSNQPAEVHGITRDSKGYLKRRNEARSEFMAGFDRNKPSFKPSQSHLPPESVPLIKFRQDDDEEEDDEADTEMEQDEFFIGPDHLQSNQNGSPTLYPLRQQWVHPPLLRHSLS
jgi:hypothetical protein